MESHRKSRRSSILKVRQTEVEIEATTTMQNDNRQVLKRRVSFHNVKTVQNFEKGDLNLLEGSPFKEKIQETMSSDGILTPGRSTAHSTPSTGSGIENSTHFADDTMTAFEKGPRERLTYNDITRYSPVEMSFGDTTAIDAPCSPSDDNLLENSVSNDDTMAAFVKGNKARLSYDRRTNYSLADMSLVETTVTDSTDAQNTAEALGPSTCHSSADMSISDNTFTTDVPQKTGVNLNTTRCSNVDMSLDSTVDCSSRSSNDTLACLENIGKPRKLASTRHSDHQVAFAPLSESSRCDITLDETMMAFVKAGQRKCIYQSTSQSPVDKLSSTTFCDDTALAFKGASTLHHTHVEEKEEIPTDSDMDVTSACTMHESGAEEEETALNKTFDVVIPNKSCQSLAEASSLETAKEFTAVAVNDDEPCEIVAANNDGTLLEAEEEVAHYASLEDSHGKAEAMSMLSATLTKTHLDSPGVVDRKRQRIMDKSEAMEELEEQRRADVSSFQRMDPISVDHLFGEKMMKDDVKEGPAVENMQGESVAAKLDSTAFCEMSMDITQRTTDAVDVTQENECGNKTALLGDTLHTLAEQVDDMEISAVQKNATTNESIYEFINESTYTKRDISILPSGSRFRPNASKDDTILSVKSLRDETSSLSCRMMFDSHSLQVNYVNVLDDQPDSNLIREQISEELATKINEMYQRSEKEFGLLLRELQEKNAVKALAVKNMATRALSFDDADMLQSARLLAEIEWANARNEVAKQAVLGTEQSIANDELELVQLIEDSRLCEQLDQLETEVQALKGELNGVPSAAEASEIIRSYENALKEKEELDREILKEEIEWLRDELQLARQRNEELRKENEELIKIERKLERNSATVRALKQQILDRRQLDPNSAPCYEISLTSLICTRRNGDGKR